MWPQTCIFYGQKWWAIIGLFQKWGKPHKIATFILYYLYIYIIVNFYGKPHFYIIGKMMNHHCVVAYPIVAEPCGPGVYGGNATPGRSIEHVDSNARLGLDDFIWTWILQIPPKKGRHHVSGYMEGLGISYFNMGLFQTWHHFARWNCHFGGIPQFWAISSWQGKTRYWKDVLISSRHFLCVFSWKLPCQIIHHGIRKPPTKTEVVMGKSWKVVESYPQAEKNPAIFDDLPTAMGFCRCLDANAGEPNKLGAKVLWLSCNQREQRLGNQGLENQVQNARGCFGCKVIRLPEVCRFLIRFWIFWGDIAASILVKLIDIIGARLYNCMDQSAMQETRTWTLSQRMGSFLAPLDFGQIRFQGSGW